MPKDHGYVAHYCDIRPKIYVKTEQYIAADRNVITTNQCFATLPLSLSENFTVTSNSAFRRGVKTRSPSLFRGVTQR